MHIDSADLHDTLRGFDRTPLWSQPTPIERLSRLGNDLGLAHLHIKRDDCNGLAFGGNKVRQLEFYFGEALARDADCVLITGAVQSNFARLTAAAARRLGLEPHLQLEDRTPKTDATYRSSGNVLIENLLGAHLHSFDTGGDEAAADASLEEIAASLRAAGRRPYVIHLSTQYAPIGALGYVAAALELQEQISAGETRPDTIIVPSGSGLTHAGFLVGWRALGCTSPVEGICVRRPASEQWPRIRKRVDELCAMLGLDGLIPDDAIRVDDRALAPGYGQMNDAVREAIQMSATLEGLMVDPIYSGRAMAGMIGLTREGAIKPDQSVLFIHTGGGPAIFAYANMMGIG